MSSVKPLRYLALAGILLLAACGGQAAPAASPSSPAPASAAAKPSAAASAAAATSAAASAKPAASTAASAKPAASGEAAAKPAASGAAAAKPAAVPAGCPSPSAAAAPASGAAGAAGSAAANPAASAAAKPSAVAKPSYTPQTDVTGEAAPGPYTENGRVTATAGTPVKIINTPGVPPKFQANTIVVKAGDSVTINVTNCSTAQHNFVSPALGVDKVDIPVGGDATLTFKAPDKPGKYMFWCSVTSASTGISHANLGDTGEVIVQ